MVTSKLEDGVLCVFIEGDLNAEETIKEAGKWEDAEYCGVLTDIRKMTSQPAAEQKKMEEWRKGLEVSRPNALLGGSGAMAALANIYVRFTGAKETRFFTDPDKAKAWLKSFISKSG